MIIKKLEQEIQITKKDFKSEFIKFIKLFNLRELLFTQITKNTEKIIKPDRKFINIMSRVDKIAKENNSKYILFISLIITAL